jgi:hypothetical protein
MLVTTKERDGVVSRTRPVYPFPKVARFGGGGNVDDLLVDGRRTGDSACGSGRAVVPTNR